MDRIGLMGITWRQGGQDLLARFTVPVEERDAWLLRAAGEVGISEIVYLATCNRVEIAFVAAGHEILASYRRRFFRALTGEDGEPGEAERTFHLWGGEGAAEHLFLVAAGLDSARVGETDVTAQVRGAYDRSKKLGLTGPRLDLVFEQALKVSRLVHGKTAIGAGRESLAEIAIERIRHRIEKTPGDVAVVGVSEMTERCAVEMAQAGLRVHVVNRTPQRAEELAGKAGGSAYPLDVFRRDPRPVEAVLLATGSKKAVLARQDLERIAARVPSGEAPLIVDMAIPPDVDPEDAERVGVIRMGMDEIIAEAERNRGRRLLEAADAREILDEALLGLRRELAERLLAPLLAAVQRRYRQTAMRGVDRLLRKELAGLDEQEQHAVRRWAETLARRFAHIPTTGLRGVAYEVGTSAVEAFFAKSDETMLELLREAEESAELVGIPRREEESE